jgi:hypothetical protein
MTTAVGGVVVIGATELCCVTCAPAQPAAIIANDRTIVLKLVKFIDFLLTRITLISISPISNWR